MKIQNENCFCYTDYAILKLLAVITLIKSCHFFCQAIHNMRHLHFSPTCVYFSNYKWILLLTPLSLHPSPLPSPPSPSLGELLPFLWAVHREIPRREMRKAGKIKIISRVSAFYL